ncbi:OX-2 membrane glycoprotein-like isoform X2 [Salminus brasiliensis]|uniref:OX-2 membrane glycoprotein-like isoform X2 n=1 Tax=Salminus brasiliensis TaxID=930266 RepID=UPI003B83A43F
MDRSCSAGIVTESNVNARFGESASVSCSLPNAAGVKQVTWQRLGQDESVHTMATFSDNFRKQVADQYAGKVELTLAMLNATTITIRNVTFADEGCYICTFNVYPSGTEREKACLSVHGLSEMTTSKADSTEKKVVSCIATGKPAPEVHWKCAGKNISGYSTTTMSNNNEGTVTTTSNLTLGPTLSQCDGKPVECVAQSGNMEKRQHIYITDKISNTTESVPSRRYLASGLAVIIAISSAICIAIVLLRKRKECGKENINTMA